MLFFICLSAIFGIQLSSAQILSLGQANNNLQRAANLPGNVILANNGMSGINSFPLGSLPVPNVQVGRNTVVANNYGNANLIGNLPISNLAVPNYGNSLASGVVSANLVSNNIGGNYVSKGSLMNANLPINLANGFNINTGTFAASNNGLAALLPVGRPCGIQIVADALEVGGSVGVNGQLPFYATVNVNGQLPSSGVGLVSCGCGQ